MVLAKKSDDSFSFNAGNPMSAGYLLVKDGGSLYGQGNHVSLDYVAVERKDQGQYALVSLPFNLNIGNDANGFTNITSGATAFAQVKKGNGLYQYDGEARSHYKYSFAEQNSTCWQSLESATERDANEGFLFDRGTTDSMTLRYTGTGSDVYTEDSTDKKVVLTQYDDRVATGGGSDFTSVYNMGWNLKGMPYLISNYNTSTELTDGTLAMNVPHLIYNMEAAGTYSPQQSWSAGTTLSPGDAFFTQTATLKNEEALRFSMPQYTASSGSSGAKRKAVGLVLSSGDMSSPSAVLVPTETNDGDLTYTINRDGAKFLSMNEAVPELAVCGAGGTLMSLVGSAPTETEMALATRVAENGRYTFSLDRSDDSLPAVSAVWLKDCQKGKVVDLLKEDYTTDIVTDEELQYTRGVGEGQATYTMKSGRFTVKLGGMSPESGKDDDGTQWKVSVDNLHLTVSGLGADTYVSVYSPDGIVRYSGTSSLGIFETDVLPGIYIIRAEGKSRKIVCRTN